MQNTDVYALQRSELNGFLFADVGTESNGMTLSVLSALSRLGLDPWAEAARLARLPRNTAIDGLARTLAAMPGSLWPMADATPIAARLVALLPNGGTVAAAPATARRAPAGVLAARVTAFLQAGGTSLKPAMKPGGVMPRSSRQWMIVVLLVAAVLAAVTLNLSGHRLALFNSMSAPATTTTTTTATPPAKPPAAP